MVAGEDENSRLFRPPGVFRVSIPEKPSHFCKGFSVQLELERETRIELATLCLGSKCSAASLPVLCPLCESNCLPFDHDLTSSPRTRFRLCVVAWIQLSMRFACEYAHVNACEHAREGSSGIEELSISGLCPYARAIRSDCRRNTIRRRIQNSRGNSACREIRFKLGYQDSSGP